MSKEHNNRPNPENEREITISFGDVFTRKGQGDQEVREVITNVGTSGTMFSSCRLEETGGVIFLQPEGTTEASHIINIVHQMDINAVLKGYKNFSDKNGYTFVDQVRQLIINASMMPSRKILLKI